jgi:hypothetical protein
MRNLRSEERCRLLQRRVKELEALAHLRDLQALSGRTSGRRPDGIWEIPLWSSAILLVLVSVVPSVGASADRLTEARIIGLINVSD